MRHILRLIWLAASIMLCSFPISVSAQNTSYTVATKADDIVTRVLFDSISTHFNVDITYREYDSFKAILDSIESGESDFAANITHSENREEWLDYSQPTNIEYTFLYSTTNRSLSELSSIATPTGSILSDLLKIEMPNVKLMEYKGRDHAKALLDSGEVEGVVDTISQLKSMLALGLNSRMLNDVLPIKPVSIVAKKGKYTGQLEGFSEYTSREHIQRVLRDTVKEYQYTLRRDALRIVVNNSGLDLGVPLMVKTENVYPYTRYDGEGIPYGLSIDTVFEACELLTLNCQLSSTPEETWGSMFYDFVVQDVDIISPIVISESRKVIAHFSAPHYLSESVLVKRAGYKDAVYRNVSELISERIGVVKGDFFADVISKLLPNKTLTYFDDTDQMLAALMNNEIDYLPIGRASLSNVFNERGLLSITEDYTIGSIHESSIAIGFAKNPRGEVLASLFNRALQMMDTPRINAKYGKDPDWRETLETEHRFYQLTQSMFIVVFGFLIMVSLYLHRQSRRDSLTHLRNRRSLHQNPSRKLKPAQKVVLLDINHFKQINDTYGHEIGDLVLQQFAQLISSLWKGKGYRIGGDEFVLIGRMNSRDLSDIVDKLSQFIFVSDKHKLYLTVTVSIGISADRTEDCNLRDVLSHTDHAMYQSKKDIGRSCTYVDGAGDYQSSRFRSHIGTGIKTA